jgi:succinyl-CoA synthetase beta subunit
MKIHEYQAKAILAKYGVPVPRGEVAYTVEEAEAAAKKIGGSVVVKAQIHAGGRGKGGGVKVAKDAAEAAEHAKKILGMTLITHQTGPEGRLVQRLLIEETLPIERELYLGIVLDRNLGKPVFMASAAGGMDIEQVAAETPHLILREILEPGLGLQPFQGRNLAFGMGIPAASVNAAVAAMTALAKANDEIDASLAEINPFILTKDGKVYALDAKITLDDNAMFRHKDLLELRDLNEEDPLEVEASRFSLNYIKLDGTIACMVNGAGLAMATMDIVKYAGGSPANFLDVGGGANAEQIKNAFRILLSDSSVKAVLINIFGGILRCDTLAAGVVNAARDLNVKVPIVIRMEGTNVEKGREILSESGFNFTVADGMKDAAEKVVRSGRAVEETMSVLVDRKHSSLIVQGFTGKEGTASTRNRPSPTAPRWWAAWCPGGVARSIWICRYSIRWSRLCAQLEQMPR